MVQFSIPLCDEVKQPKSLSYEKWEEEEEEEMWC